MLKHTLEVLEFNKIKEKLFTYIFSGLGKTRIENLDFSNNIDYIKKALKETSELVFLLQNTDFPPLGIHDIRTQIKRAKLENSYLNPEDLINCSNTLRATRVLKKYLINNKEFAPTLLSYSDGLHAFLEFEKAVSNAIDENNLNIKDSASKELARIRIKKLTYKNKIEKKLNNLLRCKEYCNAIQEHLITVREERYVIPIKKDYKGKISGIILDTSNSGNTLFMEPSVVVEDNNALMSSIVEEKQEEIRILKNITSMLTEKWWEIDENLKTLAEFEFLYAKASLSIEMEAAEISVNNDGIFKIYNARHPLLSGEIVPINLILGTDYNMLVITGPNTGGKTVSLKCLGILTLMTMAGLHIPANGDSEVFLVDNIYTDIGDEQSISQNLSTFSSHIKRISKILRNANENSLVLIDEVGAGTDPKEGSAIGIAVLEKLLRKKAKTMVSTHFAKIKNFAFRKRKVETASCEFNIKTLSPTYKILYGIPGESNAITIAKRLGLHWEIVKRANQLYKKGGDKSENVIKVLTDKQKKTTKLMELYESKLKKIAEKANKMREKEKYLIEKEKCLIKSELNETIKVIQDSRREILKILKEAKNKNLNSSEIGKAIGKIDKISISLKSKENLKLENNSTLKTTYNQNGELKEGDIVWIKNLGKSGKIISIGKKNEVTVQVGGIKFVLQKNELVKEQKIIKKENNKTKIIGISVTTSSELFETPPFELNLLGLRGDEAVSKSEKYIEGLYYSERKVGRIVHGKGEGILRKLITDMLKKHPYVKSFKTAHPNEGGYGVTEVEIII